MSDYKPYPAYKDSGVEWLGKEPDGWEVVPIKYLVIYIGSGKTPTGGGEAYQDRGILFLRSQNIFNDGLHLDDVVYISEEIDNTMGISRVLPGDVLLNITGASIGRTCLVPENIGRANVNQHVCIVRTINNGMGLWVSKFFQSNVIKEQVDYFQTGAGREGLNFQEISNFVISFPSVKEQLLICEFLDHETARIDALTSKKSRFIELLREKRQALITQAVTRGLDPNIKMKGSGVEWLGEVPEHWEIVPLKYNLKLVSDRATSREFAIALENIESWTGKFIQTNNDFEGHGVAFSNGDILFGKLRPYLAKVYLADSKGEAVGDFFVLRPTKKIYPRFAQYQILSEEFIKNIDGSTYGAKMPRVNWEFFGDMPFSTPDFSEQKIIAIFLDRETTRIDSLISKTQHSINLLKERRAALITAAVTGQIDVRNTA